MQYLDPDRLDAIETEAFRSTKPYPWANPEGLLTEEGYQALLDNMPDIAMFERKFGKQRRGEQAPHDRYSLEYVPGMDVPGPWQDFIGELRSDLYRNTIARLFDAKDPEFRFHWHYTPSGADVSPHCDSKREHGSHIWYFNRKGEWDPSWGGDTLVLDDGGRFSPELRARLRGLQADHHLQVGGQSQRHHRAQRARLARRARDHLPRGPHAQGVHHRGQSEQPVLEGARQAQGQGDPAPVIVTQLPRQGRVR